VRVAAEGSLMRRIRILSVLAIAGFAVLALASATPAGDFADGPCFEQSGIDGKVCPTATQGQAYEVKFTLKEYEGCDVFTVSSGSFPPGLTLSTDEGVARGTPTQAGNYNFYITVTYSGCPIPKNGSDQRYIINVNPPVQRLIVTTPSLPDAPIGQAYSAQLAAGGGTVSSWSLAPGLGNLPDGLTLASNGVISGTPTKSGSFTFTVQANGSPNNDTKQLSLFVLAPLDLGLAPNGTPVTRQPVPVNMKLATPFAWGVKATGGREPYVYSANTLPAGVTLNPDGTLTGTPTRAGVTRSTFTVKDAAGTSDTLNVTFTTQALLAFNKKKTPRVGSVGRAYTWRLPVSGASVTKIFTASGTIPPGLSLDEDTGVLSGTPLAPGSFRAKFWVLGDAGTQISKSYRIKIQGPARATAGRR
jgi:hypothetical protein